MAKIRHPLNCKDVTTALALEGLEARSFGERAMIRLHLAICWLCRKYERQLAVLGQAFRQGAEAELGRHALDQFQEKLLHALRRT